MIETVIIPDNPEWPTMVADRAEDNARRYESCTQSILATFMAELGIDDPLVMRAAGTMHGGMLSSKTCGVVSAGMMVLGLLIGRERLDEGVDGLMRVAMPTQSLMARLEHRLGSTSCLELTGVDFTDLSQAMRFINSSESEKCIDLVREGAREIAVFLQQASQSGQLFRVSTAHRGSTEAAEASP